MLIAPPHSVQPVLQRAVGVHPGGASRGHAAVNGAESTTHPPHEDRAAVLRHVPQTHRYCAQHHAATRPQTGNSVLGCSD